MARTTVTAPPAVEPIIKPAVEPIIKPAVEPKIVPRTVPYTDPDKPMSILEINAHSRRVAAERRGEFQKVGDVVQRVVGDAISKLKV